MVQAPARLDIVSWGAVKLGHGGDGWQGQASAGRGAAPGRRTDNAAPAPAARPQAGAVGGLAWGILIEGEPAGLVRIACVGLILAGVAGLRLGLGASAPPSRRAHRPALHPRAAAPRLSP